MPVVLLLYLYSAATFTFYHLFGSNVALHLPTQNQFLKRMEFDILTIAKNYLKALRSGKTGKELAMFFHADVIQTELPNRINPKGVVSNLQQLLERAEKGKKLLKTQTYQIENEVLTGDTVALEIKWTGVLATAVANLCAGDTLRANFAMFIQFQNGQIIKQRSYYCFEDF